MTTPLASFLMSSNFDFPPATSHPNSSTTADQDVYLQDFGLSAIRSAQSTVMEEDGSSPQSNTRRIRIRESAIREEIRRRSMARASYGSGVLASNEHIGTPGYRLRAQIGSGPRHQSRYIHRTHEESTSPARGATLQQAVERLNEASSSLHSLLGHHTPRLSSPDINTREYSGEAEVNRRRAKRRKLDGDPLSSSFKGFSYGYHGQVVPGKLKMEIFSCDGGLHTDAARHGTEYCYENVLRNDKSVYCTDSNNCNIVMCHQGKTPFCLDKLVIKAPERGFTSPIQEGLIFISMTSDDLLEKTARYQVREASPPRVLSTGNFMHSERPTLPYDVVRESNENRPTLPYGISRGSNENRPPSRRIEWIDGGVARTVPPPISDQSLYQDIAPHRRLPSFQPDAVSSPPRRASFPPNPVSFTVTTDCDDHSGDEEEESSAAVLADRLRRDLRPQPYESSSEETEDGLPSHWVTSSAYTVGIDPRERRGRRRANPSRIEIAEPQSDENQDEQDSKSNVDILAPHARFFIDMQRSQVSIKFDPPVSGKFILLKLWSPAKGQNIDIQSIIAHGFAGPRFFPAIQLI